MDGTAVNIESESFYPPERLFSESIRVMRGKIAVIRKAAEALLADSDALDVVEGAGMSRSAGEVDITMVDA